MPPILVTAFMCGVVSSPSLCLHCQFGYLIGGQLSIRESSLKKLSIVLMLAAVSTTPIVLISDSVLDTIFTLIQDPRYGSLLSATILFFLPTLISGIISPYAIRLLVTESKHSGHFAGLLYFVSTFGSAAGTILTSFYLVLYFEINHIVWTLILISLLISLVSFFIGKKYVENY